MSSQQLEAVMMLQEMTLGPKPGVGTVRLVGEAAEGEPLTFGRVEWGEYEDLTGFVHGPLSKVQCMAVLLASTQEAALEAVERHATRPLHGTW